ncbi:MAG: acyl-[acyl-carrier-protein]--UDP-N-acetylglucosamine O-acyltransferase [Gammaproteobacteria bacterium GWE2_37_16]|nr:MAG: acyl-[acyl-carrier-protein]--UDP-N-acetylglucosamine O-acyltransferase [Gammaproteobacteria bacterium GWE2_37_16]
MIDKTAIISSQAKIAADVHIGPYTIIDDNVEIDSGTWIGPHVVIQGRTKIGKNNKIFPFVSLGGEPQHRNYAGEDTALEIGDDNVIHEYCSIHRGTVQGGGVTKVGNRNFLMAYVHVAHDCILDDDVTCMNNVTLAGHVVVGRHVGLGGFTKVLQFCHLGDYCFISADTGLVKDVLPYVLVAGHHDNQVKTFGLNVIGLRRHGFSEETLINLKRAYKAIFRQNLTTEQVLPILTDMLSVCPEVGLMIEMLQNTKRGVVR